jgi:hypothetical protein
MTLLEDWEQILKRAWSIKFTALAIMFSALEVVVQLLQPDGIRGGVFAAIAGTVSIIAGVARLLAQQEEVANAATTQK